MRAYTLGNGSFLVGVDVRGQVRDVYYPRIGKENHTGGHVHRVGVHVDGALRWLDDESWRVSTTAHHDTMLGSVEASNDAARVAMKIDDVVYNEKDIFLREVTITNKSSEARHISLFFAHEFQMAETERGDTGYFEPRCHAIVHYEGRRMILIRAQTAEGDFFDQWSVGLYGIEGKEGTYKDAEDGELSGNGIEHGQVDSVIRLAYTYEPNETKTFHYWMAAGRYFRDVYELNAYVLAKKPHYLMGTATDYWRAWLKSQGIKFSGLSSEIIEMFTRSLLVLRAHMDKGGSIIASSDTGKLNQGRDTYAYMWPRDGSYAARALILAGDLEGAKRFFQFCNSVITENGYFMHKYLPDGSVGSSWHPWVRNGVTELPIQADETAIVLVVLKEYYLVSRDIEFVESVFNSLIKKAGDFLSTHVDAATGLPRPSYDLWEEIYGISTYTAAVTYGALRAAEYLANLLGKHDVAAEYGHVAEKMQESVLTHLFNERRNVFYKTAFPSESGLRYDATLDFSTTFAVGEFGILSPNDPRLLMSLEVMEKELELKKGTIGGMPRNEDDQYYRAAPEMPPNPWTVTTLWKAQHYVKAATNQKELERVIAALEWVVARATTSGMLSEQVHPITGEIIGATPLVWSHAEFVTTVVEYLQKMDDLGLCDVCYPMRRK